MALMTSTLPLQRLRRNPYSADNAERPRAKPGGARFRLLRMLARRYLQMRKRQRKSRLGRRPGARPQATPVTLGGVADTASTRDRMALPANARRGTIRRLDASRALDGLHGAGTIEP